MTGSPSEVSLLSLPGLPLDRVILTIHLVHSRVYHEEKDCLGCCLMLGDPADCGGTVSWARSHSEVIMKRAGSLAL